MNTKSLCSKCQTGYNMLLIDESLPTCPYIQYHTGKKCSFYKKMKKKKSQDKQETNTSLSDK